MTNEVTNKNFSRLVEHVQSVKLAQKVKKKMEFSGKKEMKLILKGPDTHQGFNKEIVWGGFLPHI